MAKFNVDEMDIINFVEVRSRIEELISKIGEVQCGVGARSDKYTFYCRCNNDKIVESLASLVKGLEGIGFEQIEGKRRWKWYTLQGCGMYLKINYYGVGNPKNFNVELTRRYD